MVTYAILKHDPSPFISGNYASLNEYFNQSYFFSFMEPTYSLQTLLTFYWYFPNES